MHEFLLHRFPLFEIINPANLGDELLLAIEVKVQGVVDCLLRWRRLKRLRLSFARRGVVGHSDGGALHFNTGVSRNYFHGGSVRLIYFCVFVINLNFGFVLLAHFKDI